MFTFFVSVKLVQSCYQTGETLRAFLFLWRKKREDGVIISGDMVVRKLPITTQNKGMIRLIAPPCRSRRCRVYQSQRYTSQIKWLALWWCQDFVLHWASDIFKAEIFIFKTRTHVAYMYSSNMRSQGLNHCRQGLLVQVHRRALDTKNRSVLWLIFYFFWLASERCSGSESKLSMDLLWAKEIAIG